MTDFITQLITRHTQPVEGMVARGARGRFEATLPAIDIPGKSSFFNEETGKEGSAPGEFSGAGGPLYDGRFIRETPGLKPDLPGEHGSSPLPPGRFNQEKEREKENTSAKERLAALPELKAWREEDNGSAAKTPPTWYIEEAGGKGPEALVRKVARPVLKPLREHSDSAPEQGKPEREEASRLPQQHREEGEQGQFLFSREASPVQWQRAAGPRVIPPASGFSGKLELPATHLAKGQAGFANSHKLSPPSVIKVNIGRIEVRAVAEKPPSPAKKKRPSRQPRLSLDEYLKKQNR